MIKVLVVGGTRFFGRALVDKLARAGANVTVLSRHTPETSSVEWIGAEREVGLARLAGRRFDAAVDLLCYRAGDLATLLRVDAELFAVISTAWLGAPPRDMLDATRNYLRGKAEVEANIMTARGQGRACVSIRPPIMLGRGDHTGRLAFYCTRLLEGAPVFAVEGGKNIAQIAWHEDVATALAAALTRPGFSDATVREALPDNGFTVRCWIEAIADALGVAANVVALPASVIALRAPGYLERDPLWREAAQPRTPDNLFTFARTTPTDPVEWLKASVTATERHVA